MGASSYDDREAMLDALNGVDSDQWYDEDTSVPSHTRLELDEETGEPVLARMTYVDETTCIGCSAPPPAHTANASECCKQVPRARDARENFTERCLP